MLRKKSIVWLAGMLLLSHFNAHADDPPPYVWVKPTFAASTPVKETISVESNFTYHLYKPKSGFENVYLTRRKFAAYDNAEAAFSARMSSIASLDYPWWLDTWISDSKVMALEYYSSKGMDEKYWLNEWQQQFVGRKINIKYKVEYKDFVVFIYNVLLPNGKDNYLDLPVVFAKENNKWLVSLALRTEPLLHFSPWSSGKDKEVAVYAW